MILPRTRSIHSFGVRFPVDVAFLDKEMTVVAMVRLSQWRITMPRLRANQALEAKAGSFDRHSPFGRLFPRESTFLRLLDLLNAADLEPLWGEDETIGWVYQYFNSTEI